MSSESPAGISSQLPVRAVCISHLVLHGALSENLVPTSTVLSSVATDEREELKGAKMAIKRNASRATVKRPRDQERPLALWGPTECLDLFIFIKKIQFKSLLSQNPEKIHAMRLGVQQPTASSTEWGPRLEQAANPRVGCF